MVKVCLAGMVLNVTDAKLWRICQTRCLTWGLKNAFSKTKLHVALYSLLSNVSLQCLTQICFLEKFTSLFKRKPNIFCNYSLRKFLKLFAKFGCLDITTNVTSVTRSIDYCRKGRDENEYNRHKFFLSSRQGFDSQT